MTEPTTQRTLPPKPTSLEKLLLFMVAGLTILVLILGIRVGNQGDKIDQLQVGSSDSPAVSPYHVHNYATSTHEHSQPTSTLGSPYARQGHFHRDYADEDHTHWSTPCNGTTGWPSILETYENHTHRFDC